MPKITYKLSKDSRIEEVICRCACMDEDHRIIFEKYFDDEPGIEGEELITDISVRIAFDRYVGFFRRLKNCIKYMFRHHSLDWSHYIIFEKDNIEQLEEAIKWVKKNKNAEWPRK